MAAISESELKKQIEKDELENVYFLYGSEKYMLKRAAKKIMKAAGGSFSEFNLNEFGNEASMESIVDSAVALPLMSERKCVAIADYNIEDKKQEEIKKLVELLENIPQETVFLLYFPTLDFDAKKAKWKNFIKTADKAGSTVEFKQRERSELAGILIKSAEKAGCTLSRQNANTITEYAGGDMKALLNEMSKLCAFAAGGEITAQMIEALVPKSMETTVFILSDAIVQGNYEKAYACMDLLFHAAEEPVAILSVLASSYVDMFRVKTAIISGKPYNEPLKYGDYGGRAFRLDKANRTAKSLSIEQIKGSIDVLLEADMSLKGSRMDSRFTMDGVIAKLLIIAKGEKIA